jgi:hypothetical protein
MKPRLLVPTLIGLIFASGAGLAIAAEDCPTAPREQWKPEGDVRAATEALGYKVTRVDAEESCYAVKATDKRGKGFDLKFNPTDLRLVSRYLSKGESSLAAR